MTKCITQVRVLRATTHGRARRSGIVAGATLATLLALVQAPSAGARSLPDLTISAVSGPPSTIVVETPFTVTATTTNTGRHRARPSVTRFYLSTDGALGPSDVALSGELAVGKLGKHRPSQTGSVALTLGATPATGPTTCSRALTTRSSSPSPTRATTAAPRRAPSRSALRPTPTLHPTGPRPYARPGPSPTLRLTPTLRRQAIPPRR